MERTRSPWIVGRWQDFLLFYGTPFAIFPAVMIAERIWKASLLHLVVLSLGAVGHHLPGMMRAYGDKQLFERFKVRFITAPIVLVAVCLAFALWETSPLLLMTYLWGVWHGLMQTHGFVRIYDSKWGPGDRWTAQLDHLLVLAWFTTAICWSPTRVPFLAEMLYQAGGPLISASQLHSLRLATAWLTAGVTAAFLLNLARRRRRGHAPSPAKLLTLATSIGFWWYANVAVANLLVGILLFEIFHDVQYLAIVWLFNRGRAAAPEAGRFTRFLFRQRFALLGLYLALIFGYGSLNFLKEGMKSAASMPLATAVLSALLAASTLLHFYYDGFIWKVREQSTRRALGIAGGAAAGRRRLPPAVVHALKWGAFVVPLGLLALAHGRGPLSPDQRHLAIAAISPDSATSQYNRGAVLLEAGRLEEGITALRRARALPEDRDDIHARAERGLTTALVDAARRALGTGRKDEARRLLDDAAGLDPQLRRKLRDNAIDLARAGRSREAAAAGLLALTIDETDGESHYVLAVALQALGKTRAALHHAGQARQLQPAEARYGTLVATLARTGR